MNRSTKWRCAAVWPVLAGLVACGGGGSSTGPVTPPPVPASALAYTDPTSGTFQLRRNAGLSTDSHLVLELVGPSTTTGSGVAIALVADAARVTWTEVASTDAAGTYVQNGTRFALGAPPQILKATVAGGGIQAAVAQKGTGSPVALSGALLRVALDLKSGPPAGPITFTSDDTRCQAIDAGGSIVPITVAVGSLSAR